MADKGPKIGDLLVQAGMIDQMQLRTALGHQKRWGGKIGKVVVDLGFIDEEVMLRFQEDDPDAQLAQDGSEAQQGHA